MYARTICGEVGRTVAVSLVALAMTAASARAQASASLRPSPQVSTPAPRASANARPDDAGAFPPGPLPPDVLRPGVTVRPAGASCILRIASDRPITYSLERRGHRRRLYLDIDGKDLDIPATWHYDAGNLAARIVRTASASGSAELEVEMDRPLRYEAWLGDDGRAVLLQLSPPQQRFVPDNRWDRVTIDPGHGGRDPGTIGPGDIQEKSITLDVATDLEQLMLENGVDVQLTRTSDTTVDLRPRVDLGDEFRSNVFVSIHMNHSDDPAIHGIETYYFTPKSLPLARDIEDALVRSLGAPDRGVRRDNFVVVKYAIEPACLVELGYLSNPGEEAHLDSAWYQKRAAEGIMDGVLAYLHDRPREIERGSARRGGN